MLVGLRGLGLLLGMAGLLALLPAAAGAFPVVLLEENWESGTISSTQWDSWGSPAPLLVSGGNAVGNDSLDPNGDGSYLSGLVSANTLAFSSSVRVSIDAYIESASQWSELRFGLVHTSAITQNNVHLEDLATVFIDADNQGSGHKFYAEFTGSGETKTELHANPGAFFDAWHNYVFEFAEDGSAQVRVDGAVVFESPVGIYDYNLDQDFAVLLGGRSYGTTVNLYDSISAVQVPEPTTAMLLTLGLAGLGLRRRVR